MESLWKAFDSLDIYDLEKQMNAWSMTLRGQGAIVHGEEQIMKIIGTRYIVLLRYHIEWKDIRPPISTYVINKK